MHFLIGNKLQIFIVAIVLVLQGCDTVVTEQPIGLAHSPLASDALAGTWKYFYFDTHSLISREVEIKIIDKDKGVVQIAPIPLLDEEFKKEWVTCFLMKSKSSQYLNCYDYKKGRFFWAKTMGRVTGEKEPLIIIWPPIPKGFHEAIKEERIKGVVISHKRGKGTTWGDIVLSDNPEKIIELIEEDEFKYIDYKKPIVVKKINE